MHRYIWIAALVVSSLAHAQVTGSVTGSVADPSGSAIPGAAVHLINEGTGAARSTTSNSEGNFVFTALPPAIYTVNAERPGFKKFQKEHLELSPGDHLSTGVLALSIGDVNDSVTVVSQGAVLQTESGERSGIVTSEEIQDLTVLNRDFTTFAELQPGVVITVGSQVQSFSGNNTFNVLGGRNTGNNILVDGLPTTNINQTNTNTTISLDNTQTVEVKLSNYSAEYGRNNGFTVLAASKTGTLQYHGAGYYYLRNEDFNANNFFSNRTGTPRPRTRVSYLGGNLGGPLDIPKVPATKGKLFFFISVEQIGEQRPQPQVDLNVPTALERQGNFTQSGANAKPIAAGGSPVVVKDPTTGAPFPGNVIPANRIIPSMQNYLNLLPMPNYTSAADLAISKGSYNYIYQESITVPKWLNSARLDYNLSASTSLFARFNYWWEDQRGNNVSGANTSWPWLPEHYTAITPSGVLSVTHILSPTLVFQGSMGYSQFSEAGPALSTQGQGAVTRQQAGFTIPQLFPASNPLNLVPAATFGVTNAANPAYNNRYPLQGVENTYTWNVSLTSTRGKHTLKAGFEPEHWGTMKGQNANYFAGSMNFTQDSNNPLDTGYAYSNALLGALDSYTETNNRFPLYDFDTTYEWYLQDTWKVSHNLTIDGGLRWGYGGVWHSNQGVEAGFVPTTWNPNQVAKLIQPTLANGVRMGLDPYTGAILPALTIGAIAPEAPNQLNGIVNRLTNPSYPQGLHDTGGVKTAPRVGFAWDPFGKGKTVIRGGGGIFYNFHEVGTGRPYGIGYSVPPLQYNPVIYYSYINQLQGSQGYNFPSAIVGFNEARPIQKTYNFSMGMQQDLGWGTVIDVAYVGALGRHLIESENLNSEPLGTDWLASSHDATKNAVLPSQFLRPYLGYGDITYFFYGGNSSYHSLQTTLRRRYKNNLTYGLIWTWSKAMDYGDTDTNSATTAVSSLINPKIWNYGEAGFDRTHIFRIYWNYNLPKASALLKSPVVKQLFDNWQLSGIYTAQSGAPLGLTYSYSPSQDITGSATDAGRVLLIGNPTLPAGQRGINAAFSTAAISAPPPAACEVPNPPFICWGNAGKDVFRGPGINNVDMSLFKNLPFFEGKLRAQLRVEAYNLFNHTQFTSVNTAATFSTVGVQTNGTFGQYKAAANGRNLQLALRLMF